MQHEMRLSLENIQELKSITNTRKVLARGAITPTIYITLTLSTKDLSKSRLTESDLRLLHLYACEIQVGDRRVKALVLTPERIPVDR